MIAVEVFKTIEGRSRLVGHIWFDGRTVGTDNPADPTVQRVLASRLRTPQGIILTAAQTPLQWLQSLHLKYRNAYTQVTEAQTAAV
jgi:hypothetical protein